MVSVYWRMAVSQAERSTGAAALRQNFAALRKKSSGFPRAEAAQ